MKRFFFLGLLAFVIFSCSNNSGKVELVDIDNTLASQITKLENNAKWTKEIEGDLLTKELPLIEGLELNSPVSVSSVNALQNFKSCAYPEIADLGSLDTTQMPAALYTTIRKICNIIIRNPSEGLQNYFQNEYLFYYVLFKNDLKDQWNKNFNQKYPEKNLFSTYYIAAPVYNFDLIQVPVIFYSNYGTVIFVFNIEIIEKEYKLKLIELKNWRAANG